MPFLDKCLNQKKEEESHRLSQCDYDLDIDIEKELNKVMQSVPLFELMKLSTIKEQVQEFFDKIPLKDEPKIDFGSCHGKIPSGKEVGEDPPIHIQSTIYKRKSGRHPPFYLT